jgi:hypothetical protein
VKAYEAASQIHAAPEAVWKILTDGARYPDWDSGVVSVTGTIASGQTITVVSAAAPGRTFPVTVSGFEPGRSMTWSGGMPLGLFKGVRTFTLTPGADEVTAFHVREEYSGPLLPMIWRSMPDLGPSFAQFASGLKRRAEQPV